MSYRNRERRRNQLHSSNHHRKCKSNNGKSNPRNLVSVDPKFHEAWHKLFRNWDTYRIAEALNTVWCDPDYRLEVIKIR